MARFRSGSLCGGNEIIPAAIGSLQPACSWRPIIALHACLSDEAAPRAGSKISHRPLQPRFSVKSEYLLDSRRRLPFHPTVFWGPKTLPRINDPRPRAVCYSPLSRNFAFQKKFQAKKTARQNSPTHPPVVKNRVNAVKLTRPSNSASEEEEEPSSGMQNCRWAKDGRAREIERREGEGVLYCFSIFSTAF